MEVGGSRKGVCGEGEFWHHAVMIEKEYEKAVLHLDMLNKQYLEIIDLYEIWKMAAWDEALLRSVNGTPQAMGFSTVRAAITQNLYILLLRMCDNNDDSTNIIRIAHKFEIEKFSEFCFSRKFEECHKDTFGGYVNGLRYFGRKYSEGGDAGDFVKKMHALRNKRLAHMDVKYVVGRIDKETDHVAHFIDDIGDVIRNMNGIFLRKYVSYSDYVEISKAYAKNFWAPFLKNL